MRSETGKNRLTRCALETGVSCALMTRLQQIGKMAAPEGIEPSTSDLEGPCSIQLSYGAARERFIQTARVLS